ncbi:MAG: energy transducer TonB [Prevotellaceae bacterium]|nr:energy transducer TonB [Prevotellaceae bacterium]
MKKEIIKFGLCLFLVIVGANVCWAQKQGVPPPNYDEKVYDVAEVMPQYPGGVAAMKDFIRRNLRYPASARESSIQGRVIIEFIVEKDGSLSDFKIRRSLEKDCDNEALRVVQMMPKWIPGKQNGQLVRVRILIPIVFRLEKYQ